MRPRLIFRRPIAPLVLGAGLLLAACSKSIDTGGQQGSASGSANTPASNCTPLESRAPNATGQQPAFTGQTLAESAVWTVEGAPCGSLHTTR